MTINRTVVGTIILSAIALASGASAKNGVETYKLDLGFSDFYVACLAEMISGEIEVSGRYHEFDTPSGKYHLVDHWNYLVTLTGQTSGRVWFARGVSPFVLNIGPGETFQYGEAFVARPVSGDGPKLRLNYRFKATVNANGELVVLNDGTDGVPPEDIYECLGK
jgi:hypothetical protein